MTWTQLDDRWDIGSKMVRAIARVGDAAPCMWARAVTHANREHTDGIVHVDVLRSLTKHRRPTQVIEALIEVGSFHNEAGRALCKGCATRHRQITDEEIVLHDFLEWNPSRADIEAKRQTKKDAGKLGGLRSGEARLAKQEATREAAESKQLLRVCLPSGSPVANPSPSPSPSPSASSKQSRGDPPAAPTSPDPTSPLSAECGAVLAELHRSPKTLPMATRPWAEELVILSSGARAEDLTEAIRKAKAAIDPDASPRDLRKAITSYVANAKRIEGQHERHDEPPSAEEHQVDLDRRRAVRDRLAGDVK